MKSRAAASLASAFDALKSPKSTTPPGGQSDQVAAVGDQTPRLRPRPCSRRTGPRLATNGRRPRRRRRTGSTGSSAKPPRVRGARRALRSQRRRPARRSYGAARRAGEEGCVAGRFRRALGRPCRYRGEARPAGEEGRRRRSALLASVRPHDAARPARKGAALFASPPRAVASAASSATEPARQKIPAEAPAEAFDARDANAADRRERQRSARRAAASPPGVQRRDGPGRHGGGR